MPFDMPTEIRPMPTWLQLRRAVGHLQQVLMSRHGAGAFYTDGEVRRAFETVAIRPSLRVYAFAAACNLATFLGAVPGAGDHDYRALRGELADLLGLPTEDFTMLHVERFAAPA